MLVALCCVLVALCCVLVAVAGMNICIKPCPAIHHRCPGECSPGRPSAAPQSMEMSAARKEIFRMTNGLSAAPATWPAPAPARGAVAVSTLWSRTTGYGHLPPPLLPSPLPRHGLHIHLSRQPAARAPLERICGHSVLETGDYTGTATLAPL